jgi:hypothetical protein
MSELYRISDDSEEGSHRIHMYHIIIRVVRIFRGNRVFVDLPFITGNIHNIIIELLFGFGAFSRIISLAPFLFKFMQ